jgi:hypothetical protein
MKVFICWSEERSRVVAETLRIWLKRVIQELKPFLSTQDIRAGKRWIPEIAGELAETKFGILCLTAENLGSAWLNNKVSMTNGTPANEVMMILELSSMRWKGRRPCDIFIVHLLGESWVEKPNPILLLPKLS